VSYTYQLVGSQGDVVRFESATMLTRAEAQSQAAELLNCRLGVVADSKDESKEYAYKFSVPNKDALVVRSDSPLTESMARQKGIDLIFCQSIIDDLNATFQLTTVQEISGFDSFGDNSINFEEPTVLFGWFLGLSIFIIILLRMNLVMGLGKKLSYALLAIISGALYGIFAQWIANDFMAGFAGGANHAYYEYPSLLVQDLVEASVPFALAALAHYGCNRLIRRSVEEG
jgi:hypothetical protein